MAKVTIEKVEGGMVIHYLCLCGTPLRLETDVKPKRLPTCFDCAFDDLELLKEALR